MPLGLSRPADSAMTSGPAYGGGDGSFRVRRPLSSVLRRQSAPPRPPRPELFPWSQDDDVSMPVLPVVTAANKKPAFVETGVIEVFDMDCDVADDRRSQQQDWYQYEQHQQHQQHNYAVVAERDSRRRSVSRDMHDSSRNGAIRSRSSRTGKTISTTAANNDNGPRRARGRSSSVRDAQVSAYDFARSDPEAVLLPRRATVHPAVLAPQHQQHQSPQKQRHQQPEQRERQQKQHQCQQLACHPPAVSTTLIGRGGQQQPEMHVSPHHGSASQWTVGCRDRHVSPTPPVARNNSRVREGWRDISQGGAGPAADAGAGADADAEVYADAGAHAYSNTNINPRFLAAPARALRRRPFSFESMRSAVSNYSLAASFNAAAAGDPPVMPEQLQLPYRPAQIYDEYAEIAMSNPFANEAESVLHPARVRFAAANYATPTTAIQSPQDSDFDLEPSRKSSQARNSDYSSATANSNSNSNSTTVPLSRYNSSRVAPPSPDPEEAQRQLDAAWEEVKRAVAPKLKVAIPSRRESTLASTTHALPPCPPPPPVPARNPRRKAVMVQADNELAELEAPLPARLLHSRSSPNMAKGYKKYSHEALPALPPMPRHISSAMPIPATNLPINIPAPLPTPARSEWSGITGSTGSDNEFSRSPVSYSSSMRRDGSRFSGNSHRSIPSPITTPSVSGQSDTSDGPSDKPLVSPLQSTVPSLPSPSSNRGFHEPPPIPPPIASPHKLKRYSTVIGNGNPPASHSRGYSEGRIGVSTTTIWAGPAPPVSHLDLEVENKINETLISKINESKINESQIARHNTLRSIAPGESASRQSYQPPITQPTEIGNRRIIRESVVAGSGGNHVLQSVRTIPEDQFEPIKVIPLPEKKKTKEAGEHMPRFSNNFAGFCKGAWRLQTSQQSKAFSLRNTHRKATLPNSTVTTTKTTTLRCGKCSFEGPLARHPATLSGAAAYAPSIDYLACAEKTPRTAHGIVFRWSFLFKSHVSCKTTLRKDEMLDVDSEVYACVFCCSEGKGTVCFKGVNTLCGHIAQHHAAGIDLDKELKARIGIVVARPPGKNEDWDIILPGRMWGVGSQH